MPISLVLYNIYFYIIYYMHSSSYLLTSYPYLSPPSFPLTLENASLLSISVILFLFVVYAHLFYF